VSEGHSARGHSAWQVLYTSVSHACSLDTNNNGLASCSSETAGVRKAVEVSGSQAHFFMTNSISGGTGSGAGTAVLQALRDAYPSRFIVTLAAADRSHGEVPCEALNSVLAGASLQVLARTASVVQPPLFASQLPCRRDSVILCRSSLIAHCWCAAGATVLVRLSGQGLRSQI
jgi:hypothetical protein